MLYSPKKTPRTARLRRSVAALALCAGVLGSAFGASADTMSDLKDKYAALQQQQSNLSQQLSQQNAALQTQQQKKATIDAQVANTQQQIDILQQQVDAANTQIAAKQQEMEQTQQSIDENYALLKERLRAMYMAGGSETYLTALLSSGDLSQFLSRVEVMKTISQHDKDIVSNLEQAQQQLKTEQDALNQTKQGLSDKQSTIEAQKVVLAAQQSAQAQAVAQAQNAADSVQQQADSVAAAAKQTKAEIAAEAKREEEAQAAAKKAAAAASASGGVYAPLGKTVSGSANDVINYAYNLRGCKYVYGANGPDTFDCSGFTQYVFKNTTGLSLPHSAQAQYAYGTPVTGALQAGDLVFFGSSTTDIDHVGIYVGGGIMVDAPNSRSVVRTDNIYSFSPKYVGAKRVLS